MKKMGEETGKELDFKDKLDQDVKKRERLYTDYYLTDFSNWLGMRDTQRIDKEGYVLYIADGYIAKVFLSYSDKTVSLDENVLYYLLITKFMNGYKIFIYEYRASIIDNTLVEIHEPYCSFFIKQIADINSLISSAYHIAIVLSHSFIDVTEYYTEYISNIK